MTKTKSDISLRVTKYEPRHYIVEAIKVVAENKDEAAKFCGGEVVSHQHPVLDGFYISVPTLGERLKAYRGMYIVKDSNGRFSVRSGLDFEKAHQELKRITIHYDNSLEASIRNFPTLPRLKDHYI